MDVIIYHDSDKLPKLFHSEFGSPRPRGSASGNAPSPKGSAVNSAVDAGCGACACLAKSGFAALALNIFNVPCLDVFWKAETFCLHSKEGADQEDVPLLPVLPVPVTELRIWCHAVGRKAETVAQSALRETLAMTEGPELTYEHIKARLRARYAQGIWGVMAQQGATQCRCRHGLRLKIQ